MSKQELKQKGFTIIEVVLVLAIAALIFLMVFIALPALQRSQRDTARKNDVSIVAAAVNSWAGNNRGAALSTMTAANLKTYVKNLSDNSDASKTDVKAYSSSMTSVTPDDGAITVVVGATCGTINGPKVDLGKGTLRQYATITKIEAADGTAYCLES